MSMEGLNRRVFKGDFIFVPKTTTFAALKRCGIDRPDAERLKGGHLVALRCFKSLKRFRVDQRGKLRIRWVRLKEPVWELWDPERDPDCNRSLRLPQHLLRIASGPPIAKARLKEPFYGFEVDPESFDMGPDAI
jgi:hypothetical protein